MSTKLRTLLLCVALGGGLDRPAFGAQEVRAQRAGARALVVGVGKYSNPAITSLAGPENDVLVMRTLLVEHLGFAVEGVRVLVTGGEEADRPTRARILAELDALVAARPEYAVVYLSGHGSFVPDQDGDEVDGTDEVFLPCDAGTWDDRRGVAENVILDDEIGRALTRLEDAGTFVWFLTDSCSSGTQDRGAGEEVRRVSPTALGIPARSVSRVGSASPLDDLDLAPDSTGRRVVFTACRSRQKSRSEDALHPLDADAGFLKLGVFTRLVAQEIARSEWSVTYQELIERVQLAAASSAQRPTASGALHRIVVEAGERSYLVAALRGAWRLALDVGAADGVEPGAVARVEIYPDDWVEARVLDVREEASYLDLDPAWEVRDAGRQKPRPARLGERALEARFTLDEGRYEVLAGALAGVEHGDTFRAEWGEGEAARLQVVELRPDRAVVVPIGAVQVPDRGARAKLELRPRPRRVAIDERGVDAELVAAARAGVEGARLILTGPSDADWFLELGAERHVLRLGAYPDAAAYWVGTDEKDVLSALARVYRAESLRALGADPRLKGPDGLAAELCTRASGELDPSEWTPVGVAPVSPGTYAGLRVRNDTDSSYTAWMFALDPNHRIGSVGPDELDRRIVRAGTSSHRFRTDGLIFTDDPQGLEHVLVLFVEDDRSRDFSWLGQVGLEPVVGTAEGAAGEAPPEVQSSSNRGGGEVEAFLARFAEPTRGGVGRPGRMFAQLLSYEVTWDIPPLSRPAGPAVRAELAAPMRRLFANLHESLVTWSAESGLEVVWIEGQEGSCAWASDGSTRALVLDLDRASDEAWQPELVLLEQGGSRTVVELDAEGRGVRARVDEDGDGVSERAMRRSPDGWVPDPVVRVPLLSVADFDLGPREWASLERVRAVFAALSASARAAGPTRPDASSSFAPATAPATDPATGGGESPAAEPGSPLTVADVRAIVEELADALEVELDVPLEVELFDRPEVNARAWRDQGVGKIVVFQGLIDVFDGQADLVRAVLAHELVHVVEGHSHQRTGAMDLDLHLMRAQEIQADLEGAKLLFEAGYPRHDLARALVVLDDYTKEHTVHWNQIVAGDHPSFYARIAALEPGSTAARALASFERGLAFLECRRPGPARAAFEQALLLEPKLDEATFNLVRAGLQAYYDELPAPLRETWLEPEFGPVLTEVSTVEVRGTPDVERYLELVSEANALPEGVRDPQRDFLRGTIFVLHPEDDRASIEEGVELLAALADRLARTSGDQGSALTAIGDPSVPSASRLALVPMSGQDLRLRALGNLALGLLRLDRREDAWSTLMGAIRADPPFLPPTSLATNLARLRPEDAAELDGVERDLLVDYLQLRFQTANPASSSHERCRALLIELDGAASLDGLFEAGPRFASPTRMQALDRDLELRRAFTRDDDRFGKPVQAGPLARQYPQLRFYRWENPGGEGDLVIFTENDRIVQATSSVPGSSLPLTPAEGNDAEPAQVRVGMTGDELDRLLGLTFRYHPLRNPFLSQGKAAFRGDDRWRYYTHLNLGVLLQGDVVGAVTVTPALR